MLKLCIDKVENGYVLTPDPSSEQDPSVFTEDEAHPRRSFREVLWQILEYFDELGSHYDEERIYIVIKPGEDYIKPKKERVKATKRSKKGDKAADTK